MKKKSFNQELLHLKIFMSIPIYVLIVILFASIIYILLNSYNQIFNIEIGFIYASFVLIILGLILYIKNAYVPIIGFFKSISLFVNNSKSKETVGFQEKEEQNLIFKNIKSVMDKTYAYTLYQIQAEISMLQSQINPHFLYNTLDSIRGQALEDGAVDLANMIEALGIFFRYSISHKGNIVTLEDELKNVDNYIIIQRFRFYNRICFEKIIEDMDYIRDCRIPKLTFQPIIENALSHGLETKCENGKITVRITATDKKLLIHITDNGIGMDTYKLDELNSSLSGKPEAYVSEEGLHKKTGIALKNVNSRIRLFFGNEYGVHLTSTQGIGTDVEIILPIIKDDNELNFRAI